MANAIPKSILRHARYGRLSGFTLIELLVVISILIALLGLSVFTFRRTSKRFSEKAAAAQLETVFRQARNSALSSGAPAFVELEVKKDTPNPRVIPWAYRVVGLWHFEDDAGNETSGAFNNNGIMNGCRLAIGKIGKGMALVNVDAKGGLTTGYVDCLENKDYDCADGGYLEAYIFAFYPINEVQYIFHKDKCYALAIAPGGVMVGRVGAGEVLAKDYQVPIRRWTKVAFAWDRRSTRLLVDDAVVGVGPGMEPLIKDTPLFIGDDTASFQGLVDEARIMTTVRGRAVTLPAYAKIKHNAQPWDAVFFSPDGGLDIRYHTSPVQVTIVQGRKRRAVTVSMLGLTERHELLKISKEEYADEKEAEEAKNPRRKKKARKVRVHSKKPLAPTLPKPKAKAKEKSKGNDQKADPDSTQSGEG